MLSICHHQLGVRLVDVPTEPSGTFEVHGSRGRLQNLAELTGHDLLEVGTVANHRIQ